LEKHYPPSLESPAAINALFDTKHPEVRIPPKAAILVGQAVYNFRAALDYLVCALSKRIRRFRVATATAGLGSRSNTQQLGSPGSSLECMTCMFDASRAISRIVAASGRLGDTT